MNKTMIYKAAILSLLFSASFPQVAPAQFDPAEVDWSTVKSKVRWLNYYHEQTLLTLSIDSYPALKKMPAMAEFRQTIFPAGNFATTIHEIGKDKALETFALSVEEKKCYTLVTTGGQGEDAKTFLIPEEEVTPLEEGQTDKPRFRITLFNAVPGAVIAWKPHLEAEEVLQIPFTKSKSVKGFIGDVAVLNSFKITLPGRKPAGLTFKIPLEITESTNWVIFCHLDGGKFEDFQISYLQEGTGFSQQAERPMPRER